MLTDAQTARVLWDIEQGHSPILEEAINEVVDRGLVRLENGWYPIRNPRSSCYDSVPQEPRWY